MQGYFREGVQHKMVCRFECTIMSPFRKILMPTDGSENTKPAIQYALDLAKLIGAEVTALSVIDTSNYAITPKDATPIVDSPIYREGEDAVRYLVDQGRAMGLEVKPLVIKGIPADEIIRASRNFDLIVMGTLGRTGITHLLLGSVAERVIRSAYCPVLVVHSD